MVGGAAAHPYLDPHLETKSTRIVTYTRAGAERAHEVDEAVRDARPFVREFFGDTTPAKRVTVILGAAPLMDVFNPGAVASAQGRNIVVLDRSPTVSGTGMEEVLAHELAHVSQSSLAGGGFLSSGALEEAPKYIVEGTAQWAQTQYVPEGGRDWLSNLVSRAEIVQAATITRECAEAVFADPTKRSEDAYPVGHLYAAFLGPTAGRRFGNVFRSMKSNSYDSAFALEFGETRRASEERFLAFLDSTSSDLEARMRLVDPQRQGTV
jgi:hypothetical protein